MIKALAYARRGENCAVVFMGMDLCKAVKLNMLGVWPGRRLMIASPPGADGAWVWAGKTLLALTPKTSRTVFCRCSNRNRNRN